MLCLNQAKLSCISNTKSTGQKRSPGRAGWWSQQKHILPGVVRSLGSPFPSLLSFGFVGVGVGCVFVSHQQDIIKLSTIIDTVILSLWFCLDSWSLMISIGLVTRLSLRCWFSFHWFSLVQIWSLSVSPNFKRILHLKAKNIMIMWMVKEYLVINTMAQEVSWFVVSWTLSQYVSNTIQYVSRLTTLYQKTSAEWGPLWSAGL